MNQRTCKTCDTAFTSRHSRQVYCEPECRQPEHRTVILNCDCCGGPAIKYAQAKRWGATYCSTLCRDYTRWGKQSCQIPSDHISRVIGKSCRWTPPQLTRTEPCTWCGESYTTTKNHQRFCSLKCKTIAKRHRRRALEYQAPGTFNYVDVMRQYQRQGFKCAYCGQQADGLPDPEHVVPLSRGGRNDMTNIVASCRPCNSDKRDLLLAEWAADRARRGKQPINIDLSRIASHAAS